MEAVNQIDGPVLVIAGPGTGKTQLISTRVANILQKTDAKAHNILCLTFTESAAHEMRERLINIIGQLAYNVTISTYHAFGSELLQRFPEYFNDAPGERAIDELGIHRTIQDIIKNLPYSNSLKKSEYYIPDIVNAISDCKRALLEPSDLRNIARANQDFISKTSRLTKKILTGIARMNKKCVPAFRRLLAESNRKSSLHYVLPGVLTLDYLWSKQLREALDTIGQRDVKSLTAWKNAWLARDDSGDFVVSGTQTNRKLADLATVYEQYLMRLSEQSLYDYDDMILRATRGLEENRDLRFTLQEQYNYILLDEFQDTNAAQLKLVKLLCDNPLYEGRPNIMAVGDDDQAIYAFQGADYSHMLAFRDMFRDTLVINLVKNYRSHPEILHLAHGIVEQIEERLHKQLESSLSKTLSAESKVASASIERHEFKSDVSQYAWVAKKINQLIKGNVSPSDIAVIAPQHRYLEPIMPYLSQSNIPVRYDKRENVLDDPHIRQLLRMAELTLALHKGDVAACDSLWPEVLSYDFWQIPTATIWKLSWQAHDTRQPWSKLLLNSKQLRKSALFFAALAGQVGIETLETMLDYLVGTLTVNIGEKTGNYASPFYIYNFSKEHREHNVENFWNLLSNLTVLRQNLREYNPVPDPQLSLEDLVEFAQAHKNANLKVLNTSPYHESAEAVQVMTAYKAKGMEFAHVFVLACLDEVWGSKISTQNQHVPLPVNMQFVRYQGTDNDERLRLFFVTLTRAKEGIYLTSYTTNFANKPTTHLKYLNETEAHGQIISPLLPDGQQQVMQDSTDVPDIKELSAYWQVRHSQSDTIKNLASLLKPRLDRYQLAPTHLNSFTDLVFSGPEHFFMNTILRFPRAPTKDGQFGNAIHETLEWANNTYQRTHKLPTQIQLIKVFRQQLRGKQLGEKDYSLLQKRGEHCLKAYVAQKLKFFRLGDAHEVNFRNQGVFVGDAHLSGKIDRLIINRKNKTVTIVDFKTGTSFDRWKSDVKLHKYKQQLYLYKLLVEGSYAYDGYRVEDAYLQFVEPNDEGKIVDLHIRFTPDEMQHTKQLIRAVWQHIKHLDFPAVDQYQQNLRGIKQFEDELIKKLPRE